MQNDKKVTVKRTQTVVYLHVHTEKIIKLIIKIRIFYNTGLLRQHIILPDKYNFLGYYKMYRIIYHHFVQNST